MTENTASNPSKKRKANDGRATLAAGSGGFFLSSLFGYYFSGSRQSHDTSSSADQHSNYTNNDQFMQQTLSHMEKMEQSMLRMEEKLSSISSVERRCEALEAKCSSLENLLQEKCSSLETKLDLTSQSLKNHVDTTVTNKCRSLETNLVEKVNTVESKLDNALELLHKNQNWTYPVAINSYDWLDDENEATFLVKTATALREKTIKMRTETFPDIFEDDKAIVLVGDESGEEFCSNKLLPHWVEFATALKQFTPSISDSDECHFMFGNFRLGGTILELIKEALIGKPFEGFGFSHNLEADYEEGGLSMDAILEIVESNKRLKRLAIYHNTFSAYHVERLCSVVENYPLVHLELAYCCNSRVADSILTSLLANRGLKLDLLSMNHCGITSNVSSVLADFLASNTEMTYLDLQGNDLNDNDIAAIATALRSNTTLESLSLKGNDITDQGVESAFRFVLFDESSLNAAADSNHWCYLHELGFESQFNLNRRPGQYYNRGRKIYKLLSSRNRTMSNTKYFDDVDVKTLPYMLENNQAYETTLESNMSDGAEYNDDITVASLSIVYEIMRKWDKVFSLYE